MQQAAYNRQYRQSLRNINNGYGINPIAFEDNDSNGSWETEYNREFKKQELLKQNILSKNRPRPPIDHLAPADNIPLEVRNVDEITSTAVEQMVDSAANTETEAAVEIEVQTDSLPETEELAVQTGLEKTEKQTVLEQDTNWPRFVDGNDENALMLSKANSMISVEMQKQPYLQSKKQTATRRTSPRKRFLQPGPKYKSPKVVDQLKKLSIGKTYLSSSVENRPEYWVDIKSRQKEVSDITREQEKPTKLKDFLLAKQRKKPASEKPQFHLIELPASEYQEKFKTKVTTGYTQPIVTSFPSYKTKTAPKVAWKHNSPVKQLQPACHKVLKEPKDSGNRKQQPAQTKFGHSFVQPDSPAKRPDISNYDWINNIYKNRYQK